MKIVLRLGLAGLLLLACTPVPLQTNEAPKRDDVATSSTTPPPPSDASTMSTVAAPIVTAPIAAWTDPVAIDALARSCSFDPNATDAGAKSPALVCAVPFSQGCAIDPCLGESEEQCDKDCSGACESCGKTCVNRCESCKSSCHDDACRRTCAESCGQCRQACMKSLDECGTRHCAEIHAACREKKVGAWIKDGCDAVCDTVARCKERCRRTAGEYIPECQGRCFPPVDPKSPGCNPFLCEEMKTAPERKKLDPKWSANHCDDVCTNIWACATKACNESACAEPIKMYNPCAARIAGANACGLREVGSMCEEPQH